jgi:hypothetical protein
VKSCYNMLVRLETPVLMLTCLEISIFTLNWKSSAPSKVSAFSWQDFLDRIPSRVNLALRGVINPRSLRRVSFVSGRMSRPNICSCTAILPLRSGMRFLAGWGFRLFCPQVCCFCFYGRNGWFEEKENSVVAVMAGDYLGYLEDP